MFLVFAALAWAGCDAIASKLGIDKVAVPLGSAGKNLAINTATASAQTASLSRPGGDLPDVFDVASILLESSQITFTPTAATKTAQSGTVRVAVVVSGYPAILGDITIVNDIVTQVSPAPMPVGAVDMTKFNAMVAATPQAQRPVLASDYATASGPAIRTKVGTALRSTSFSVTVLVQGVAGGGTIAGTLTINQGTFNLDF